MRTNIDLDDDLVAAAFRYSDARTKKDLVHQALREFVDNRRRRDPRLLKKKVVLRRRKG